MHAKLYWAFRAIIMLEEKKNPRNIAINYTQLQLATYKHSSEEQLK